MADVLDPPSDTSRTVVMPKYEPGVHTHYASGQSTVLGWGQVAAGVAVVGAAIVARSTYMNNLVIGDIFVGILMILTGAFGVAAGKYRTTCPIISLMMLAIASSNAAIIAFFVWVVEVEDVRNSHPDDEGVAQVTGYIFIFAYLFEVVASIWSAVIACNVTCCGYRHPMIGVVTTRYLHPRGNMTVMFAHSSSSSSSPPDNPRPYMQDGCVMPQSPPPYGMFQSAGYGRQQQGYGMQQQGYGMPQQQGYGMPQQQGYGMQQQQGFGMPQQQGPYGQEKPPDYVSVPSY